MDKGGPRRYLAAYFTVPSREGFSAYRSGWIVHFIFSVLLGQAACLGLTRLGASSLPLQALAALLAVVSFWGVGVFLGVVSHYNPLLLLLAVAGVILSLRFASKPAALGVPLGAGAHALAWLSLSLLQRLRRHG